MSAPAQAPQRVVQSHNRVLANHCVRVQEQQAPSAGDLEPKVVCPSEANVLIALSIDDIRRVPS